jgi:hypothetical protein
VPDEKPLAVGALLVAGQLPGGYMSEGWDVPAWLAALDTVLADSTPEHVVAGHGEPLSGAELVRTRDYFEGLWKAVLEQRAEGRTLEEARPQLHLERRFPDLVSLRQFEPRLRGSIGRVGRVEGGKHRRAATREQRNDLVSGTSRGLDSACQA